MTGGDPRGVRRRLVLWAAGLSTAVAVVQVAVVHLVIDRSAPESLAERVEGYTVWSSIGAGVAMVALATGLSAWAGHRVLAPVAEMARTAADWSEHDLDRRFDLGPPTDEILALGQTLDGLLDKVAQAILGEQRLTAELAHELRSPLTAITGTADLIAMRPDLDDELREDVDDIRAQCRAMAATITGLLDLARAAASSGGRTRLAVADGALDDALDHALLAVDRDRVTVSGQTGLAVAVPPALAARILAPLLDNATRLAERVVVRAVRRDRWVEVTVSDDGPGVAPELADVVFQPGRSGGAGSGLGLSLARRVARSVGGDVWLADGGPGATFVVRLPAG